MLEHIQYLLSNFLVIWNGGKGRTSSHLQYQNQRMQTILLHKWLKRLAIIKAVKLINSSPHCFSSIPDWGAQKIWQRQQNWDKILRHEQPERGYFWGVFFALLTHFFDITIQNIFLLLSSVLLQHGEKKKERKKLSTAPSQKSATEQSLEISFWILREANQICAIKRKWFGGGIYYFQSSWM